MGPQLERRKKQRYGLKLPVIISAGKSHSELQVVTRDVSADGIFFFTGEWPEGESSIEFKMIFPAELTLTDVMRATCKGRVVRVENSAEGRVGVAATIDSFTFA